MPTLEIFTFSSSNFSFYDILSNWFCLLLWIVLLINIVVNDFIIQHIRFKFFFYQVHSLISWRPYKDPLCWFDACTHTWKFLFYFYFDISFKPFWMASFAVIRMTRIPIDSPKRTNITCNVHHLKLYYVVILLKRCEKVWTFLWFREIGIKNFQNLIITVIGKLKEFRIYLEHL